MKIPIAAIKRTAAGAGILLACISAAPAIELVTAKEAAYPDDPYGLPRGGPIAGPDIKVISPTLSDSVVPVVVTSPFHLEIKFAAHGGATMDPDSIKAIYR